MSFNGIRDLESEKQLWSGHCRVSRAWLGVNVTTDKVLHFDLILMDAKGNDIWVHIPPVLQEHFKRLLQEQQVYTIRNFELHTTQLKYRPIANTYIMSFSRKNTVEHVPDVPSIPAFKFNFLKASEMASKLNDVVVLSGSGTTYVLKPKPTLFYRGDVVKVIIWGRVVAYFDKLIKPGDDEQVILVVTAVSVKPFLGELCFNSSGSTVLYPNLDIPEVKAFTTRYRIQLDVESNSVLATFIIFEYEAKRFFGVSGNDLFNRTGQNN
ncbi:unnamed protein product, partial [Linum tenue]